MNIFKSVALSLVMLSSLANAKVSLEAAIVVNGAMVMVPAMTLECNQPASQLIEDVLRFQATLTESNTVVLDLAAKDENENYISFLQPELALAPEETKAVLEMDAVNGNKFVLIVQVNEIKE